MMEEWKIQNIFSKCQKRKFWNIFEDKSLNIKKRFSQRNYVSMQRLGTKLSWLMQN